jgi:hypothetical protein
MAKISLPTAISGYNLQVINDNFDAVEAEFQNKVLYRDNPTGEPNQMENNLDMNSNNILNTRQIDTQLLKLNGVFVSLDNPAVVAAALNTFEYTATASQTTFSVSPFTPALASIQVIVDGLQLPLSDISVSGTSIITPAQLAGAEVMVRMYTQQPTVGVDASVVTYVPEGAGAETTTVQTKLRESVSVMDFGAVGDGVTDALLAFDTMSVSTVKQQTIPDGTYALTADWTPAVQNVSIEAAGGVSFSGVGKVDFGLLVPFQARPIWAQKLIRKTYDTSWTGGGNVFQLASYATTETTDLYTDGYNVVAVYGGGDAKGAGSSVWGGNFVAYANNATAKSIGIELNCGTLVAGGLAYGLVIASAGNAAVQNAIQVQANNAASAFDNGIEMRFRAGSGGFTGSIFTVVGQGDAFSTCASFLKVTQAVATGAEIDLPSFIVEATQASTVNRISIRGAATGSPARINVSGTDAAIGTQMHTKGTGVFQIMPGGVEGLRVSGSGVDSLQVQSGTAAATISVRGATANADVFAIGKGTGGVRLRDGASADKIHINTTGIGFNASSPIAKPTISGSRGGNAALASLLTQLASYGLITDGTSV